MAIAATIVHEVRTAGADTNGGGFKPGASGQDLSIFDTAQYAVTDGVTAGTTTITSATANFDTNVVGNLVYVQGGTGSVTAGWYEITVRNSATSITVDRSTGLTAGTGVTLNIGGALLTIAQALTNMVDGNTTWVKAGTGYTITTMLNFAATTTGALPKVLRGYGTTRGDNTKPTISTASAITMMTMSAQTTLADFLLDGGGTATNGVVTGANPDRGQNMLRVHVTATKGAGITCSGTAFGCMVYSLHSTATVGFVIVGTSGGGLAQFCIARDLSCPGFSISANLSDNSGGAFNRCIAARCTVGFSLKTALSSSSVTNCVSVSNSSHGIDSNSGSHTAIFLWNNVIAYNSGWGITVSSGSYVNAANAGIFEDKNAFISNSSGNLQNLVAGSNDVTLTADPFTDKTNNDFSLNTTAGGGAACRAAGYPGVWTASTTTGYSDLGAVQHADPVVAGNIASGDEGGIFYQVSNQW